MNVSEEPPDEMDMFEFNQECFKEAPLTCQTLFNDKWIMSIGFMAENTFNKTNELEGFDSDWLHDEQIIQLKKLLYAERDEHLMITKIKYESICHLNLEIQEYPSDGQENEYHVTVTFVTTFNPIFSVQSFNEITGWCYERFYYQKYRSAVDGFWKDLIEANAFQIVYKIEKRKFNSWMKKLFEFFPSSIKFRKIVNKAFLPLDNTKLNSIIHEWPGDIQYLIACIQSLGIVGRYFLDYRLFHQNDITLISYADGRCDLNSAENFLLSMYMFLKRNIALPTMDFNPSQYFVQRQKLGPQYVWIKSVTVTPTAMRFEPGEYSIDCRGFRKLGHENILQVKFRDEDLMKFPRDDNCLKTAMFTPLFEGIKIGGRSYFHFGESSSLFRDNGSYFLAVNDKMEIAQIIKQWGKFDEAPASKVEARIGQFFTSAKQIDSKLIAGEIAMINDYKTDDSNFTFSDGNGILDPGYAAQIQFELNLPTPISAVQIRCLGFKGMMAVDPHDEGLASNGGPYKTLFRKSQKKFKDLSLRGPIDFDIAQIAGPAPFKLHRSFIVPLISLALEQRRKEIVERKMHELLTSSFMDILRPLYDQQAFFKVLEKLPKYFPVTKLATKNLINQPFLRSLVEAYTVYGARLLNDKSQITIPEHLGRSALGVVDETGLLKPGQIFFQFSNCMHSKSADKSTTILTSPVGVTKSPLYHQGDIRFLEAVDIPELHHLKDVVVFPNHGERPIPDEIGGGDLDGDKYNLFWLEEFFLEHSQAADYTAPDSSKIPNVTIDQLHHQHAIFRMDYWKNNNLEKLSNIHLAHSILHSPNFKDVETIAKKADIAVNYFKSGVKAPAITRDEEPIYFPSFMEKRHEPSFKSDHILCQLYERSSLIYSLLQLLQTAATTQRMSMPKKDIVVNSFAQELYQKYSTEIRNLLKDFGVKSEGELFSNLILELPGFHNFYKYAMKNDDTVMSTIQASVFEVYGRYRKIILNKFDPKWHESMKARNENLYSYMMPKVTDEMKELAKMFSEIAENDGILSFPWICFEGLDLDSFDHTANARSNLEASLKMNFDGYHDVKNMPPNFQERYTDYEMKLIQLVFTCGLTFNVQKIHDTIISNHHFVISVPKYYTDGFQENYQILKELSGCTDLDIRIRRNKGNYMHFTIWCSGTLKSCRKLNDLLTPFVPYDHEGIISLQAMKQIKTAEMQKLLKNLFGFPEPPITLPHSRSARMIIPSSSRRQQNSFSSSSRLQFPFTRMHSAQF